MIDETAVETCLALTAFWDREPDAERCAGCGRRLDVASIGEPEVCIDCSH